MKKLEDCIPTCSSCAYFKPMEGESMTFDGECFAHPPRGQFVTDADGDLTIMFYRPQIEGGDRACSDYKPAN